MLKIFLSTLIIMITSSQINAGPLWDKAKEVGSSTVDIVSDTATSAKKAVKGEKESPETRRHKIDKMSLDAISRLFEEVPAAKKKFNASPAYAVFDTRKMSLLITTEFGSGVAIDREKDKRVYMKMATGGVNLGLGAQFYQIIFIFPSRFAYLNFVKKGWDAGASADAIAGKDAENASIRLPDGTEIYKLNDKGVMLSASLTGTKYWKDDELNKEL